MFWKQMRERRRESHAESERCAAELEYEEGRRLRLQRMFESAQESYEACIARLEGLNARDASRLMLKSLRGIGDCLHEQERYEEAQAHYLRAQELDRQTGEVSAETPYISNRLGRTWQAMGDRMQSEQAYRESLAQVIAFRGERHADTAMAHSNLGTVLLGQDRFHEAQGHLEKSLEIRQQVFPPDHPSISQGLLENGKAWGRVGRYDRAFVLLQKCKEMRLRATTSLFGAEHADVADVLFHIGRLEEKRGASRQAIREFRQCLAIRERVYDGDHPTIASALNHLGHSLHHNGQSEEALKVLERCLKVRQDLYGNDHLRTARAYSSLGYVLQDLGRSEEALRHLVSCASIRRAQLPKDHPDRYEVEQDMIEVALGLVDSATGKGQVIPMRGLED